MRKTLSSAHKAKPLTGRQLDVLWYISLGRSRPEVAKLLGTTVSGVNESMALAISKLGALNTPHAIRLAMQDNKLRRPAPPPLPKPKKEKVFDPFVAWGLLPKKGVVHANS